LPLLTVDDPPPEEPEPEPDEPAVSSTGWQPEAVAMISAAAAARTIHFGA
jgi:hypothetical protein